MLLNNRRMYINRHCNSKEQTENVGSNCNESKEDQRDGKDLIIEAFKSISENIGKIRESIAILNEKVEKIEARQIALEQQIDNEYPERRTFFPTEFSDDKKEQKMFKSNTIDMSQEKKDSICNRPVMPGSGFSNITPEYLKSLKKNSGDIEPPSLFGRFTL